ncbi:maleylpyruvate isomerase N-terminal domain-containing protein [Actinoplanes sp. NPDC024001]|uniref:maleylpyruvate isomerase N-terminal domain-containing protein n=1 Tax=Actinoplanes sp. NPDC024001 TaxID=3154598 RepID=UPI0033E336A1
MASPGPVTAGGLSWTVWETVEHIADDLFAYAGQLAPEQPALDAYVPFGYRRRPDGPALTVYVKAEAGVAGLLHVLDASGGLLAAQVQVAPPQRRAFHPMGVSDPEGFAAMGVVEVLAHMHDVAAGLGVPWSAPDDLCDRVLWRLFPEAPLGGWPALLWATGRGELPARPRLADWRWHSTPRQQEAA